MTNVSFQTLKAFWDMANVVTRDKVKDIQIDFWTDENQVDVICSYKFKGWLSGLNMNSGQSGNHTLNLQIQPTLGKDAYVEISLGN